jgi:hypothetical protein
MHRNHPHLYINNTCRCCHRSVETNDHFLECPHFEIARVSIWNEFIEKLIQIKVRNDEKRAKENEERVSEGKRRKAHIDRWNQYELRTHFEKCLTAWMGMSNNAIISQAGHMLASQANRFRFKDIVRGMVPQCLAEMFHNQFEVSPKILQKEFLQLWRWLQHEVWEKLWKPRNQLTIEWEIQQGITEEKKRQTHQRLKKFGPAPLKTTQQPTPAKCKICQQRIDNNPNGEHIHGGKYAQRQLAFQIHYDHIEGRTKSTGDYKLSKGATKLEDYIGEYIGDELYEKEKKTKKQKSKTKPPNNPRRPNRKPKQSLLETIETNKRKYDGEEIEETQPTEPPDPLNNLNDYIQNIRDFYELD